MSYNYDGGTYNPAAGDSDGNAKVIGPIAHDAADTGKNPVKTGGVYDATLAAVGDGDIADHHTDKYGRSLVNLDWTTSLQAEETLNDSDKSFVVPASTEWIVAGVRVEYTSTAVAGNRQVTIEIQDGAADVICEVQAGILQAASLTRYYQFGIGLTNSTAFTGAATDFLMTPLIDMPLPATWIVRVYDKTAVDAAADDMVVQMIIKSRTV